MSVTGKDTSDLQMPLAVLAAKSGGIVLQIWRSQ